MMLHLATHDRSVNNVRVNIAQNLHVIPVCYESDCRDMNFVSRDTICVRDLVSGHVTPLHSPPAAQLFSYHIHTS